ncbi:hypothetical protein BGX27_001902 [Mortierella sp. AM989]|nr:hypothetical protein BGX27_001902 [Mortierella sp. AM989]
MENNPSLPNSTGDATMSESNAPKLADLSPANVIASISRSVEESSRALDLTSLESDQPLDDTSNDTSIDAESNSQSEVLMDNVQVSAEQTSTPIPQEIPLIDLNLPSAQSSIPQPSSLPLALAPIEDDNTQVQFPETIEKETNDDIVVMDSGTALRGTTEGTVAGSVDPTPQTNKAEEQSSLGESAANITLDQPIENSGGAEQLHPRPGLVTPWQDLVISMLSELGLVESSRMMAAEELVLSAFQRQNAPGIIQKFARLLQESTAESGIPSESLLGASSGSSKRNNSGAMDIDSELNDAIKRRRVDNATGLVHEYDTREEIEQSMVQFMASKREQINKSNRQEFIKGRPPINAAESGTAETQDEGDDGCARADARKLNRTIQMKLETVKNEALTKTNPKTHAQISDTNMSSSGLDERLRNIQVHLNLRIAAVPTCTIAERIRIVEDVIIQLERDYPLWSALHFNQPNRMFPPPPSVTTVSRNSKNQIVITGDHLHTTLIDYGDPLANAAALAQYPTVGLPHSVSGSQTASQRQAGEAHSRTGTSITNAVNGSKGSALAGPGKTASVNSTSTGGSATVIKLKRHGGAGSSSLARTVQQQLALRKANAAAAGHTIDESRTTFSASNNGSTPSFKIVPTPYRDSISDSLSKSGSASLHVSSPGSASSLSPTIDFSDPLKLGVTGRGPIKSRRKSIAKGLDPVPAVGSMTAAHPGNILGSNPGTALSSGTLGVATAGALNNQSSAMSEGSLGSFAIAKPKPVTAKKPRKKKGEGNADESATSSRAGAGRGKGGFGLGKGKGGGRPMGLGLGKGKGGAYREEMLRRAEVEEFEDESDEDIDDDNGFQPGNAHAIASAASSVGNGTLASGNTTMFINDGSALAHLVSSALKDQAAQAQQRQQQQQQQQQLQQSQQGQQIQQPLKSKKQPRKQTAPAKPPPVRKFGGKSFGMAGGESSGSSSNESSDGEGTGSSGSQSGSSSSGSISGSDPGDSD